MNRYKFMIIVVLLVILTSLGLSGATAQDNDPISVDIESLEAIAYVYGLSVGTEFKTFLYLRGEERHIIAYFRVHISATTVYLSPSTLKRILEFMYMYEEGSAPEMEITSTVEKVEIEPYETVILQYENCDGELITVIPFFTGVIDEILPPDTWILITPNEYWRWIEVETHFNPYNWWIEGRNLILQDAPRVC
jgi:hypothetical protein